MPKCHLKELNQDLFQRIATSYESHRMVISNLTDFALFSPLAQPSLFRWVGIFFAFLVGIHAFEIMPRIRQNASSIFLKDSILYSQRNILLSSF